MTWIIGVTLQGLILCCRKVARAANRDTHVMWPLPWRLEWKYSAPTGQSGLVLAPIVAYSLQGQIRALYKAITVWIGFVCASGGSESELYCCYVPLGYTALCSLFRLTSSHVCAPSSNTSRPWRTAHLAGVNSRQVIFLLFVILSSGKIRVHYCSHDL